MAPHLIHPDLHFLPELMLDQFGIVDMRVKLPFDNSQDLVVANIQQDSRPNNKNLL